MDITNAVIYEVLAKQRPHPTGASNAGSRRRPFPWVGTGAPVLFPHGFPLGRLRRASFSEPPQESPPERSESRPELRREAHPESRSESPGAESAKESYGITATLLAIVVAALI